MPIDIHVVRRGTESTDASRTDGGVLKAVATVVGVLSLEPDESLVRPMLKSSLEAEFGAVTENTSGPRYGWVTNPSPPPAYIWVCDDTFSYEIDDGGAEPVLVTLVVRTVF